MKSLIAHAVLAVGGLGLAYAVWTDDGRGDTRAQVTVWDCDADHVTRVHLDGERYEVTLERRGEGEDATWWVSHASHSQEDADANEFTAAERVSDYLEGLGPLRASREVGQLDDETLAEVGLQDAADRLVISCGGKDRTFLMGENAFGSGDRYMRDERGGAVYLADASLVRDLESAQARLMQRKLHTFEWKAVAQLEVEGSGAKKTLLHRNRHDPSQAQWVDAEAPDRRNELYGNWLNRLRRLNVVSYLGPDDEPGGDGVDVQPVGVARFFDKRERTLEELRLVRTVTDDAVEYYARTGATRSWVQLPRSLARQVAHDVRPVLGLEAVDEPEPVASPEPEAPEDDDAEAPEAEDDTGAEAAEAGGSPAKASDAAREARAGAAHGGTP